MPLLHRAAFLAAAIVFAHAAEPAAGRWEGTVRLPGRALLVVFDLAQTSEGGWIGSAISPALNIAGAPLSDIAVKDSTVSFVVKGVLGGVKVNGTIAGDTFTGTFEQAGNSAPLTMKNAGTAQVEPPRQSTAVAKDMEGDWEGDMTVVDHNVHARLTLTNQSDGHATAKFFLHGRRDVNLDVAMVTQESDLITLEIPDAFITFDGRLRNGEISGVWQQGPYEFPLALHRAAKTSGEK